MMPLPIDVSMPQVLLIGSATNLPTGVRAAWSSNILTISGTPSVAGTYAYSVPLTGGYIILLRYYQQNLRFTYASATFVKQMGSNANRLELVVEHSVLLHVD